MALQREVVYTVNSLKHMGEVLMPRLSPCKQYCLGLKNRTNSVN